MLEAEDRREERRLRELAWMVARLLGPHTKATDLERRLLEELVDYDVIEQWDVRRAADAQRRMRQKAME